MQKKLLAAAVSGALGTMVAPVALAQNATVNVYGSLYAEYAQISHGMRNPTDIYQNYDHWQNPGSAIGFRGEEKLGGGMSAWFQCETTMDYRGSNNTATANQAQGICNRDSAFGLKGAFGNVFMGNWGTPMKRVTNDMVGANDTGVFGAARVLYGQSSTFGVQPPNAAAGAGSTPGAYRRRQSNLLSYDTPNFSGFTGMVSMTTGNAASGATSAQLKSRLWSLGGQYNNGPISVGLTYERHNDFYSSANVGSDEHAWALAGSYTFSNNLKLGAQYSEQKADVNALTGANTKVKTWHVGIDWMISGPHGVRVAYSHAGDVGGTLGAVSGQRPTAGPGTSATLWQARYVYQLSKRTEVAAGYVKLNNNTNANYEIGGASTTVQPGSDARAVALTMSHKF